MDSERANILLVEDDRALSRLLKKNLERTDKSISCITVQNLSNALETLRKGHFDNVLLDLNLNDSSSFKTLKRIRQENKEVPIVVLTSSIETDIKVQAIRYGADDYIIKGPQIFKDLVKHIRRSISKRKTITLLKRAYTNFKTTLQNTPSVTVCISPEGKIIELNKHAYQLWENKNTTLAGKSFLQTCISRNDRFNVYVNLRQVLTGQTVKGVRTKTFIDENEHIFLWDFELVTDDKGCAKMIVAVAHDISRIPAKSDALKLARNLRLNPDLSNTIDTVITSLCAILDQAEKHQTEPPTTSPDNLIDTSINPQTAASVEQLVWSIISQPVPTQSEKNCDEPVA
jgi:DNA-binding response OmpR family regulator